MLKVESIVKMLEEDICFWYRNLLVDDEYSEKCLGSCDGYKVECSKYVPVKDVNEEAVKNRVLG